MSTTVKQQVEAQCPACSGTGLYRGFAEPKDVAVVCVECNGSGKKVMTYIPFTERQKRKDVKYVQKSRGSFIGTGVGPTGGKSTYEEFLAGEMP